MTFGRSTVSRDWSIVAFGQDVVFAELKSAGEKGSSEAGLMLFMQPGHGAVLRKETGRDTPRIIGLVTAQWYLHAWLSNPTAIRSREECDGGGERRVNVTKEMSDLSQALLEIAGE